MRILGIDYGEARTGFAITDELGITAQGLETLQSNGSDKLILKKIDELLEIYNIGTIVVGMPYNMNGTKSERAELTEKLIEDQIENAKIEKQKNTKLYKTLGVTVGLAAVILLL